jgi:hypothetical protein
MTEFFHEFLIPVILTIATGYFAIATSIMAHNQKNRRKDMPYGASHGSKDPKKKKRKVNKGGMKPNKKPKNNNGYRSSYK